MVVMDHFSRRIIGFSVQAADLDARWGSRLDRFLPAIYVALTADR
jgi:hypothetical protein